MRILQVSDVHLDLKATRLGSNRSTFNKAQSVYLERLLRFEELIQYGIVEQVDAIVLSGDIHNKPYPSPQEYSDFFRVLDKCTMPVYIIAGNHDEPTNRGCALDPLWGRRNNIYVATTEIEVYEEQDVYLVLAPWGAQWPHIVNVIHALSINKTCPIVLIHHVNVIGADGHNWGEVEGEPGTVTLEQLKDLQCNAIMLGHYHGQIELYPGIWYCGSPEMFNFGETEQEKGALMWDINRGNTSITPIKTTYPKYITIDWREFLDTQETWDNRYLRITGDIGEQDKIRILAKVRDTRSLGIKLSVRLLQQIRKTVSIQCKTPSMILQHYLQQKQTQLDVTRLLTMDSKLLQE